MSHLSNFGILFILFLIFSLMFLWLFSSSFSTKDRFKWNPRFKYTALSFIM